MIKFEDTEVIGWEHAIRGMRNPMNSWDQSDSLWRAMNPSDIEHGYEPDYEYVVGDKDYDLMTRLRNAGTDHRKFMRMIAVYVDITAPLYWWKEFDTYKVGTVANSCSTMHKIHAKEFTMDDFSHEHLNTANLILFAAFIGCLEANRKMFLALEGSEAKKAWYQMIQLLPTSYNQKRTVMLNYEVLANIYKSRKNHKLDEWREFCQWIETLPYSELITRKGERNENKENDTSGNGA